MAGPESSHFVPDLHCFEDLPDFDCDLDHLHHSSTSTKDEAGEPSAATSLEHISKCAVCSSFLCCNDSCGKTGSPREESWSPWAPDDHLSYHDIWCDDYDSWEFSSSCESEAYDHTTTSQTPVSSDSIVPEIRACPNIQDFYRDQGSSYVDRQGEPRPCNLSAIDEEAEMSEEDIFAGNLTYRPVEQPISAEEGRQAEHTDGPAPSGQPYTFSDDDGESQRVPSLPSLVRTQVTLGRDDMMEQQFNSSDDSQSDDIILNPTCEPSEQVVPSWTREE